MNAARGIACLSGHPDCLSVGEFARLGVTPKSRLGQKQLSSRIEHWVANPLARWKKDWYHGWTTSQFGGLYVDCFLFKYLKDRVYGFLCNPDPCSMRYRVFVPVLVAPKNEFETDETYLARVLRVLEDPAVNACYPGYCRMIGRV